MKTSILLAFIGLFCHSQVWSQSPKTCQSQFSTENYGNGTKTKSVYYFKNCQISSIEEIYYDAKQIDYRTITIKFRKDGTRKYYSEKDFFNMINEKRYDETGQVEFEKKFFYNQFGLLIETQTSRDGITRTQTYQNEYCPQY